MGSVWRRRRSHMWVSADNVDPESLSDLYRWNVYHACMDQWNHHLRIDDAGSHPDHADHLAARRGAAELQGSDQGSGDLAGQDPGGRCQSARKLAAGTGDVPTASRSYGNQAIFRGFALARFYRSWSGIWRTAVSPMGLKCHKYNESRKCFMYKASN